LEILKNLKTFPFLQYQQISLSDATSQQYSYAVMAHLSHSEEVATATGTTFYKVHKVRQKYLRVRLQGAAASLQLD
jgi:hypothetical protein